MTAHLSLTVIMITEEQQDRAPSPHRLPGSGIPGCWSFVGSLTDERPVIVGHRACDSLLREAPSFFDHRLGIVLTRQDQEPLCPGCTPAFSPEDALGVLARRGIEREVFVIGGTSTLRCFLRPGLAERVLLLGAEEAAAGQDGAPTRPEPQLRTLPGFEAYAGARKMRGALGTGEDRRFTVQEFLAGGGRSRH